MFKNISVFLRPPINLCPDRSGGDRGSYNVGDNTPENRPRVAVRQIEREARRARPDQRAEGKSPKAVGRHAGSAATHPSQNTP
jgi:hypothetical protein